MTCARLKDVCQSCIFDLKYGLPVQVRDAVLNIKETVPKGEVNREYYMAFNAQRLAKGNSTFGLVDYDAVDPAGKAILTELSEKVKGGLIDDPSVIKRNLPQPCSFFAKGACNRGETCPYRHELSTEVPSTLKTYHARYYGQDDWLANRMMEKLVPKNDEASKGTSKALKEPPTDQNICALQVSGIKSNLSDTQLRYLALISFQLRINFW